MSSSWLERKKRNFSLEINRVLRRWLQTSKLSRYLFMLSFCLLSLRNRHISDKWRELHKWMRVISFTWFFWNFLLYYFGWRAWCVWRTCLLKYHVDCSSLLVGIKFDLKNSDERHNIVDTQQSQQHRTETNKKRTPAPTTCIHYTVSVFLLYGWVHREFAAA